MWSHASHFAVDMLDGVTMVLTWTKRPLLKSNEYKHNHENIQRTLVMTSTALVSAITDNRISDMSLQRIVSTTNMKI